MKRFYVYLCAGVMALSLAFNAGDVFAAAAAADSPVTAESALTAEERAGMVKALSANIAYAYSGISDSNAPVFLLLGSDNESAVLTFESATENTYVEFAGKVTVDESGITTITSNGGYYISFTASELEDGTYVIDCGQLGKVNFKEGAAEEVVDTLLTAYEKENVTIEFLTALSQITPEQGELLTYINETIKTFANVDQAVLDSYKAALSKSDKEAHTDVTESIIPQSEAFIKQAESVTFESETLKNIHATFINRLKVRHEAYGLMKKAIEESNADYVTQANAKIAEADVLTKNYHEAVNAYALSLGVSAPFSS